jgi:hypothetical protein
MSARRRAGALLAACALACAPSVQQPATDLAPLSYREVPNRLGRSVGLLRRMCLAQTRLEASPADPRWCMDRCDTPGYAAQLEHGALRFLEDWRGYEVVRVTAEPDELAALVRWASGSKTAEPPESLRSSVRELGRGTECDAVVALHGKLVYLTYLDGAAWFASFALAIPLSMARIGTRVEADVFEVRTGRLAWSSRLYEGGSPGAELSRPLELAKKLFEPIELALPRVLTATRAESR